MDLCLWIAAGLALLAAVVLGPHNVRIARARRAYRGLPIGVRAACIDRIAAAGGANPPFTLLLPWEDPPAGVDAAIASRLGGVPYAEAGDTWPALESDWDGSYQAGAPAPFLLQVLLDHPGLGPVWQGRLLTIYLRVGDEPFTVRAYRTPSPGRRRELTGGSDPLPTLGLRAVPSPVRPDGEALLESVPGLADELRRHHPDPRRLLVQVLRPEYYSAEIEAFDLAFVGGTPEPVQGIEELVPGPACPDCGKPMRFLLQFGDFVPGIHLGDTGTGYVYGCDDHPDRLGSAVQMT